MGLGVGGDLGMSGNEEGEVECEVRKVGGGS